MLLRSRLSSSYHRCNCGTWAHLPGTSLTPACSHHTCLPLPVRCLLRQNQSYHFTAPPPPHNQGRRISLQTPVNNVKVLLLPHQVSVGIPGPDIPRPPAQWCSEQRMETCASAAAAPAVMRSPLAVSESDALLVPAAATAAHTADGLTRPLLHTDGVSRSTPVIYYNILMCQLRSPVGDQPVKQCYCLRDARSLTVQGGQSHEWMQIRQVFVYQLRVSRVSRC